jgi:hypothetical protein
MNLNVQDTIHLIHEVNLSKTCTILMSQKCSTCRQPEPKENPECSLVKEGENCPNSNSQRTQELFFQPVTFSRDTLASDQKNLNDALNNGFNVVDSIKTETGIVYVLSKKAIGVAPKVAAGNENIREYLRNIYENRRELFE